MSTEPKKVINSSPRARFISNQANVDNHRKLIDSVMFQTSEDAAMAEFVRAIAALGSGQDLAGAGAQQAAAASFHMICGAYNFMEVFHRLAEPYAQPVTKDKIVGMKEPDGNN